MNINLMLVPQEKFVDDHKTRNVCRKDYGNASNCCWDIKSCWSFYTVSACLSNQMLKAVWSSPAGMMVRFIISFSPSHFIFFTSGTVTRVDWCAEDCSVAQYCSAVLCLASVIKHTALSWVIIHHCEFDILFLDPIVETKDWPFRSEDAPQLREEIYCRLKDTVSALLTISRMITLRVLKYVCVYDSDDSCD